MQKIRVCGQACLLFTGIFLICFGTSLFIFFDSLYDFILECGLQFNPTSLAYQGWFRSPPVETNIYMFNWTNPDQIRNTSVLPEFVEIGPYRFYEIKGKANVSWFENYVSYKTYTESYFDERNDGRNLSDVINIVNTVAFSIGYQLRFQTNYWTKKMISFGLSSTNSKLHVTRPVNELLFDGYDDSILGILSKLPFVQVPQKGGLFYGRNGTSGLDGTYNMHFTNDDYFGNVLLWDNKNETNFFTGQCNAVKGSAGEFFPLNRKRDQIVMFSSDLCKYLVLEYVEDVIIKGVRGYKYSADNGFDNGTVHPENACFCNGECIPTGVFNISSCRQGSPSFLSFPHFYSADPSYRKAVKGMRPDKTQHEFYMILEPKSGIVMEVQAGMQLNMLLHPISSIRLFENVPKTFMPVFFIVHKMDLSDEIASSLRLLQNLPDYSYYIFYTFVTLGCCCLLVTLYSLLCKHQSQIENIRKKDENMKRKLKNNGYEQVILKEKPLTSVIHEQVPLNEKMCDIR